MKIRVKVVCTFLALSKKPTPPPPPPPPFSKSWLRACQRYITKAIAQTSKFSECITKRKTNQKTVSCMLKAAVLPNFEAYQLSKQSRNDKHSGASPAGGQCPRFSFLPPPPIFFLPTTVFFGRKKLVFLGGKFVFSARKRLRISTKAFFVWRSPAFGRKICDFGQKKRPHFGENLCPPDFNFAPPISRSWRRPCKHYHI